MATLKPPPGFMKRPLDPGHVAQVEAATIELAPTPTRNFASGTVSPPAGSTAVYKVGAVYDVPLHLIKSNPVPPRYHYDNATVSRYARTMAESGQQVSAIGFGRDGFVVLIDGETRLRSARQAGLPTLRIEIQAEPIDDKALYEQARAANVERSAQTPIDDALQWKSLFTRGIYRSQVQLANALSLEPTYISRVYSLADLPEPVLAAIFLYPELMTVRVLNALREYWQTCEALITEGKTIGGRTDTSAEAAAIQMVHEAGEKPLGFRDITARRLALTTPPVKRTRSQTEAIEFKGAKGSLKCFEDDGRVELTVKGLSAEDTESLTVRIKAALAASSP